MPEQSAGQRPATRRRSTVVVALAAVASPLVWVALALACSPHASVSLRTDNGVLARPGAQATVTGNAFDTGRVDVRWDSTSGPILATSPGPSFSVSITIPAAAAGFHNVVAIGRDLAGNVVGQAVTVMEIPEADTAPAASDPPAPSASSGPAAAADVAAGAPASSATASAPSTAAVARPAAPASRPATRAPSRPQTRPDTASRATTKAGERRPPRSAAPLADTATRATSPGAARVEAASSPRRTRGEPKAVTARRSVEEQAPRAEATSPPSLVGPTGAAGAAEAHGTRFGIGIALLAIGLTLPLAGFVLAEARRRRQPVGRRR